MPPFWQFLCRTWFGLSSDLAHSWWGALSRSHWSASRTFREAVVDYDKHPAPAQRPTEDKLAMSGWVAPQALMALVEDLVREGVLLRRDSIKLEEAILAALDAAGQWCVEERRSV